MTGPNRRVRAFPEFFIQIDAQLPHERDGTGRPTGAEFEAHELIKILEQFENGWDDLPELTRAGPEYRILIGRGRLVYAYSVIGHLAPDGSVELVTISIDTETPW